IDIAEDNVRLAVQLPRLLMMLASKARALVERQGRIMLEKK
ncbi:MAG: polyhydroxyalkanoic acid synthase, partial [Hyphomicrobiales bacterium]|nr:polyhydroxyalkanoic acid synthase [Hyphomicrobiales bacterium]